MELTPIAASLTRIHNPFDRRDRDLLPVPAGISIAEALALHLPMGLDCHVSLNGRVLAVEEYAALVLSPGDSLAVVPVVQGGDIGKIFTVIAVAVVAFYTGGAGMALLAGAATAAVTALLPTLKPKLPGPNGGFDASQAYSWSPITTQQAGLPIARCYGEMKLTGNIIAASIEDKGTKQYANALIDFGLGPYDALNDFCINDQPYGKFASVSVESRLGTLNQSPITFFDDTRLQASVGVKLVKGTPYTYSVPNDGYDALEIEITAPQGLWYSNDSGGMDSVSVTVKAEFSGDNGTTWAPLTVVTAVAAGGTYNYWSRGYNTTSEVSGMDGDGNPTVSQETVWVEVEVGTSIKSAHSEGEKGASVSLGQGRNQSTTWKWLTATAKKAANVTKDTFTLSGASQQPVRKVVTLDGLTRGAAYQLRLSNLSADQTSSRYGDDIYLSSVTRVLKDDFQYPRTVLMGVRALATDQLSGSMNFSVIAKGAKVRVWNGSAWAFQWSANPAWVCFDVLTQPVLSDAGAVLRYDGIDPARLDLPAFKAWADWCDTLVPDGQGGTEVRCRFDGVFDTETNLWNAALDVCQSARAILIWNGVKLSVTFDRARTTPVQLFSVGNIAEGHFTETFLPMADRANEMEIDFVNRDNSFERDRISIVDTQAQQTQAVKASLSLIGVTRPTQAWREAMYRLNRNRLLTRTVEFGADIDAIACTVGDLILIQHDVPMWGEGGRLVSGTPTSLVLDKAVTLAAGKSYEITVRFADDTLATRAVSTSNTTTDTLALSSPLPQTPAPYTLYALGEVNKSTKPFVVTGISRDGDQRMTLSVIEYDADIYTSDSTLAPAIDTQTPYNFTTEVTVDSLVAELQTQLTQDGTLNAEIRLFWNTAGADAVRAYTVLVQRPGFNWMPLATVSASPWVFSPAIDGATYGFKVQALDATGNTLDESDPLTYTVDSGNVAQIPALTGIALSTGTGQFLFQCDRPASAAFDGIEVHVSTVSGFTPSSATLAYQGPDTQCSVFNLPNKTALPSGTPLYLIAAGYTQVSKGALNYSGQITLTLPVSTPAALLTLSASSQVFQVKKDGSNNPASVTLSAVLSGALSGNATFTTSPNVTLTGSGNTRTLTYANMGNNDAVTVTASLTKDGTAYSDSITVVKVREGTDGANAVTALLTNEAHTLAADSVGTVLSYTGASTTMQVYVGAVADTANWTFAKADGAGVASTISGNTVTVSSLTADAAYVDITASRTGYSSITKRFSLSRAKAGVAGQSITGPTGDSLDIVYVRASSQPSKPGNSASSPPSGWYTDVNSVPAGSGWIYSSVGTKLSGATQWTWDVPVKIEGSNGYTPVKGVDYSDGAAGLSIAELTIYARSATVLSTAPTGGSYNFGTKTLTPPSGWSSSIPSGTDPTYAAKITASIQGTTGSVTLGTWTAPVVAYKNGQDGQSITGQRGTVQIAYATPNGAWVDSDALTALSSAGYGTPVNRDVVTLYKTGAFSTAKFYSGTYPNGSWLTLDAYINGNLLVDGTIAGRALAVDSITANKIVANEITTAKLTTDAAIKTYFTTMQSYSLASDHNTDSSGTELVVQTWPMAGIITENCKAVIQFSGTLSHASTTTRNLEISFYVDNGTGMGGGMMMINMPAAVAVQGLTFRHVPVNRTVSFNVTPSSVVTAKVGYATQAGVTGITLQNVQAILTIYKKTT